jgi:hypothetical protein
LLLQAAVVIVVLVLSLLKASDQWTMVAAAGCSCARCSGALLVEASACGAMALLVRW